MRKIIVFCLILLIVGNSYAGTISRHTTYATGSEVNATNLNGNFNNIINECNGGLDNNNADTANGFRFYEVLGANPSAGTEGRMVYNTANDNLVIDNGSAFSTVTSLDLATANSWSIGDNSSGDITLTFNGDGDVDGTLYWDTSEDYFALGGEASGLANYNGLYIGFGSPNLRLKSSGSVIGDLYCTGATFLVGTNSSSGMTFFTNGAGIMDLEAGGTVVMSNLIASQYVKTDANKKLISSATFTAGHYYPINGNIKEGDSVILVNGKIEKSTQPKDSRCVGIYIYSQEVRDSITNIEQKCGYVISIGDSSEWENTMIKAPKYETDENLKPKKRNGKNIVLEKAEYNSRKVGIGLKVCDEGGQINAGDLLCTSSTPGYLMKQDDDIKHSYTVAKSLENVQFKNGKAEGVYGYLTVH